MRTKQFLVFIIISTMISCHVEKTQDSPDELKNVLYVFFEGIKSKDIQKLNEVTSADFMLYENGKIWNTDSLMHFISSLPDFTVDYKLSNLKMEINNDLGYMYYSNKGEFLFSDTDKMTMNWVESAGFKKFNNTWKITFLHSTILDQGQ